MILFRSGSFNFAMTVKSVTSTALFLLRWMELTSSEEKSFIKSLFCFKADKNKPTLLISFRVLETTLPSIVRPILSKVMFLIQSPLGKASLMALNLGAHSTDFLVVISAIMLILVFNSLDSSLMASNAALSGKLLPRHLMGSQLPDAR